MLRVATVCLVTALTAVPVLGIDRSPSRTQPALSQPSLPQRSLSRRAPPVPTIVRSPIPMTPQRLEQTADYFLRHYGERTYRLDPRAIVLHYTCGPSYRSAWHTFASNGPRRGEGPGLCAHYIIDLDGTTHELVPPTIRCRHANGINHVGIGIEFVQPCLRAGASAVEQAMLSRTPQITAGLSLVRHLRHRFRIRTANIMGHAMVNRSPLFFDLQGRSNDHGDWRSGAVSEFVRRLDESDAAP